MGGFRCRKALALLGYLAGQDQRLTESLGKWAYTSIVGFEHPETDVKIWLDVFAGLGFDLPLRNYVGILNGEPVAKVQLFLAAGVAGIYAAGTVPDARQQGMGAELRFAGYDGLVITGHAEQPVYLWVDELGIEVCDATHLWAFCVGCCPERLSLVVVCTLTSGKGTIWLGWDTDVVACQIGGQVVHARRLGG